MNETIDHVDQGQLFVVSAPSGAGKTSLVKALIDADPTTDVSVSHTTRKQRPGEVDGVNYHFVDEHQFHDMLENDEFLEWATVFDHLYGTSIDAARLVLDTGKHVILEIDWQGAQQIRQKVSGTQTIFIFPPSLQALRDRLTARAQDDPATIERRTASALEELSHWSEFDYLIVNDDFDTAVSELRDIVAGQGDPFRRDVRQTELKSLVEELLTS